MGWLASLGIAVGKDLLSRIIKRVLKVEVTQGSGGGVFKFMDVFESLLPELDKLVASGKIGVVNQDELKQIIQLVVDVLNNLGLLKGSATEVPTTPGASSLLVGKILKVQVIE